MSREAIMQSIAELRALARRYRREADAAWNDLVWREQLLAEAYRLEAWAEDCAADLYRSRADDDDRRAA